MGFARGKNVKGIAQGKFSGSTASSCALNYKHCGVHLGTLGSCQPDKHHSRTCWQGAGPQEHEEGFLLYPGTQNGDLLSCWCCPRGEGACPGPVAEAAGTPPLPFPRSYSTCIFHGQ